MELTGPAVEAEITRINTEKAALIRQQDEASALISVIERAATNPNVDIDKMERLLQMQERILQKQAEIAFNVSLTAAQEKMRPISADAQNPQTKSKYASYAQLDKALRPIYIENGFNISFNTGEGAPPEHVRVLCYLSHSQGHSREYHVDLPSDGKGAKGGDVMTKTHAVGSGLTYGMRYLLKMVFNVAIGEDDNDGNAPVPLVSEEQALTLHTLIHDTKSDLASFLRYISHRRGSEIKTLEEIPASEFQNAVAMLEKKRRKEEPKAVLSHPNPL